MIAASHLTRRFGSRVAVNDVTFTVDRGEIVALLGPNGAGKTTTMRMLAGLIAPTSGAIAIDGAAMTRATADRVRGRIGFLTEAPGLWERLTVRENLIVYARLYGLSSPDAAVERALERLGLAERGDTRAAELSKGMRQKAALARALIHDPQVLLLDEPTSGLDPEVRRTVRTLLEERRDAGCAILISTHNLDEAERLAHRVAVLQGKLLAIDPPSALRRRLTGRLVIRVAGDAAPWLDVVRPFSPGSSLENGALAVPLASLEADTPAVVSALVAAGARILEVTPQLPGLEDVYLRLVGDTRTP